MFLALACGNAAEHSAASGGASSGGAAQMSGGSGGSISSAGVSGSGVDDALIAPPGVEVSALPGGNGVLDLFALTIQKGASNIELYAALRNDGSMAACDAAVSVELFDHEQQSLAAGIGGLHTRGMYRLNDGSGKIASCVAPGEITLAAISDLPAEIALEDIGYAVYRCPYFALDVTPIAGLTLSPLAKQRDGSTTSYTGALTNGLSVPVSNPSVSVFPVNRGGRPLGVATAAASSELSPGASWAFTTNGIEVPDADYVAFPAAAPAN